MSLYNNVIQNVNREDEDDEDKLGYEFWNKVENAPVIKQIGNYFQQNNANIQAMNEYARSKENDNLLSKGLAWTAYGMEQVVGAPFQLIDMGLDELSDRTNIDKRSLKLGLDLFIAAKGVKGSKTGAFNKGVQTRQGINKQYNKFANIFKKPGDQLIDIKSTQVFDDIAGLSLNDTGIARLLNPIFTAKELGLDPTGTTFYSIDKSKYQPPENFSSITPPTFEQARQKINRAIGSDIYIRHADGVPRFDFVKLQDNKVFTSEYKRLIGSDISTIDEFGLPFAKRKRNVPYESRKAAFVGYRKELMDQYLEWYGPAMNRLGIKPSQIDLDHRLTLIQSLGIYHNVDPKSQLWIDIQNTAVRRGIYPGDAKRNLDLADPESHRVKSNYFNDLHGLSLKGSQKNMKYWSGQHRNSGKTRLQIMEESHLGPEYEKLHLEVVNDYFDVVERGNRILDSARAIWHAENMKGILPEEIVTTLMQVSIDPQYSPKQLKQIVDSMMDVEIEKYSKIQRLFQIEEELDLINASPETILDTDPQDIKDLKKEWKQLKTVRKSKWFKKHYERMMDIRDKEIASPQRNIFEILEFLFPDND